MAISYTSILYSLVIFLVLFSFFNIKKTNGEVIPNVTVAQDGSGKYTKVMDAVLASPNASMTRYVIFVKKGVYKEKILIGRIKWNITMIGEGMDATIISGSIGCRGNKSNACTYDSATFDVSGSGFIAQDISIKNTAGPENGQAVALKSDSDLSVFYKVGIFGYQDSLLANTNRQFYKECRISGTVDFIFGYATAVFQNCLILARKGTSGQKNTITAQGGVNGTPTGFVFQFCNISADSDLVRLIHSTSTYLGRPWHPNSRVVFMESNIGDVLSPEGWLEWEGSSENLDTLFYAEYKNSGPGANLKKRVKWSGYHVLNSMQASNFTVANFISGDQWLPLTGIPFISGLGDGNTTR